MIVADLRQQSALTDVVDARIWAETPDQPGLPFVRLSLVGAFPVNSSPHGWLERNLVQCDCYGSTKQEAWDAYEALCSAMETLPERSHAGAVVTGVRFQLARYQPDEAWDYRPRYISDIEVWARPTT